MLNYLPVLIISTTSAWLASGGPRAVLENRPGLIGELNAWAARLPLVADGETLLGVVCFALGAALQVLVVWAWKEAFRTRGWLNFFVPIGLAFSFGSAITSSGMALLQFESFGLFAQKVDAAAAPTVAAAGNAVATATDITGRATALAERARDRARIERSTGGTCANETAEGGPGKLMRFRDRHSDEWVAIATAARSVRDQIEDAVSVFHRSAPSQAAIDRLVADVRARVRAEAVADASRRIARLNLDMQEGWFDHEDGVHATCDDPGYTAAVERLRTDWDTLAGLSLPVGYAAEPGMGDAYRNVLAAGYDALAGRPSDAMGRGALATAFAVELIQILLLFAMMRRRRAMGLIPDDRDVGWGRRPRLPAGVRALRQRVARVVDRQTMIVGGQTYFVSAQPPRSFETEARHYLGIEPSAPCLCGVPKSLLERDPTWFGPRREIYGDALAFDFSPLPKDYKSWRSNVSRDGDASVDG